MWLIIIVKNFWSFWWLSFENCNFICSVTYTSFNVLDKLFLSCSLPDFQNSNPVMFTPLHIRYYLIIFDTKIVKKFENSKISNFVKKCSPDEYPKYVRFLEERRRTFIDHVKFSLSLVCSLKYRFHPLFRTK